MGSTYIVCCVCRLTKIFKVQIILQKVYNYLACDVFSTFILASCLLLLGSNSWPLFRGKVLLIILPHLHFL